MAPSDPLSDPLSGWRARLRAVPVFDDDLPVFDVDAAPEDPLLLVAEWLDHAIASGVRQPHAATFVTLDAARRPSSRTLILKDLDAAGLWVATSSTSPAGLARSPSARASTDPATWTAYLLRPSRIELFAADVSRSHTRLQYARAGGGGWGRDMLAE